VPGAIVGFAGPIVIDFRLAALTVSNDVAVIPPNVPLIVEVPMLIAVARPLFVIEATPVAEDCHCVTSVTS